LAVEADSAALAEIGRDDMGYTESTAELVQSKLKNTLKKEDERVLVAVCGETVVGFIHAEQYDVLYYPTMVNILGLAVRVPYRRFGIATKLLAAVEDWARTIDVKEIRLNSGITRLGAHEFYRRNGFTDEKEQKRFLKILK
jgi:GNAT superfamily N-acetyltransferase